MKLKGYFLGCLSSATYGLIPFFALNILRSGQSMDSLLFYRFFCAALIIGIYLLIKRVSLRVSRKEIGVLILLGLLFALSSELMFSSYAYMPTGIVATILFIYPVFVAIIMNVCFHEKTSWVTQVAILFAFIGVALLYYGDGKITLHITGIVLILLSALAYALYIITINKSIVSTMSGFKLTFYALSFCALFFFCKALATGNMEPINSSGTLINILFISLVCTAVSCIAMSFAIGYIGSTMTAVLGALEPMTAVTVGVIVFDEPFTPNLMIGILFIITSVIMIVLSNKIMKVARKLHHKPL